MATPENTQLADFSVDPNVVVPRHIREASAAAEALHAAAYPPETPAAPEPDPATQLPEPPVAPEPPANPEPPQAPVTATVNPDDFTGVPSSQELKDSVWAGRYNSMRGRYETLQRQVGAMQQQMRDLAGELQATQGLLEQRAAGTAVVPPASGQHHEQLITPQDRETYGDELIDLTQRAARAAVEPQLDALRQENTELKKRVVSTAQGDLKMALQAKVPNWVAINRSPEFNAWLSLPNIYNGEVRGKTLRAAYSAANAPRVIAIFEDFLKEVRATGAEVPGQQPPQVQGDNPPPARQAAVSLESLAAPGRARPSGGGDPAHQNADKPLYTRADIAANYASKRKGQWAGRDADWNRLEADMIAAGQEGRVR